MNLIVLSGMYPNQVNVNGGIFVEKQVIALKKIIDGEIFVVAPIPWSPRLLWYKKKWQLYGKEKKFLIKNNIKVFHPRYFRFPGRHFGVFDPFVIYYGVRSLVRKLASTNNGDAIIHAHTILPVGLAAILLKKELKIPVICTAHGGDTYILPFRSKLYYYQAKTAINNADTVVAVSERLKKIILEISPQSKNVQVITNGIDLAWLEHKASSGSSQKPLKILFVGRLSIEKGIEELLRAFLLLSTENADSELVLVGKNMTSWLETFLNQHELQDRVKVTGEINHAELTAFYENASIFVLPSHMEGMPTVMFEAMGVGLPVIISDVGGVSEVIKNNVNGLLIKAGDWKDLYLKLKLLINDEKLRARLGAEARKTVDMHYTWDINAGKMQKIYSTLR